MSAQFDKLKELGLSDEEMDAVTGGGLNVGNLFNLYESQFRKCLGNTRFEQMKKQGNMAAFLSALGEVQEQRKENM